MKSPFHFILGLPGHIKHPEGLFQHFHKKIHHAFALFGLAIIGMLWGSSMLLKPISANWQPGGFLTQDFWDQNPSNANIMYALFGDGTPGATSYTKIWNTSCIANTIQFISGSYNGGTLNSGNTIYIINSGNYTLSSDITISGNCVALVGNGTVTIHGNTTKGINITSKQNIIIDNIRFHDAHYTSSNAAFLVSGSNDIAFSNIQVYNNPVFGILLNNSSFIDIYNSQIYNNTTSMGGIRLLDTIYSTFNNLLVYNNYYGILFSPGSHNNSINNSQFFNNVNAIVITSEENVIENTLSYNNGLGLGINANNSVTGMNYINNFAAYNNTTTGIYITTGILNLYGTIKSFANTSNTGAGSSGSLDMNPVNPTNISSRTPAGDIDTTNPGLDYDVVTNPQNGSGQQLLSGTNRTGMRGTGVFDITKRPIRYIFGGNILKQIIPVWYNGTSREEYGDDGTDYVTTQYIAEPAFSLSAIQEQSINQYFGSGSTFTQNRQTNGCSLSAFQVVYLNPGTFPSTYNFQDHTIYILTGGEYRSSIGGANNGFVFNGNCIALIGNNTTVFTKSGGGGMASILYANNKRNIIIDTIKVDGFYYNTSYYSAAAAMGMKFEGASNNITINNSQIYNNSQHGIYLGLGSHHNSIMDSQIFNNTIAGIHLYYSSNYNVINNTQMYNNGLYGIWFANGSSRNTMNNFQIYNNTIGIFGDLTTQENVFNRAAIYNNSDAGIYLKNSSDNIFNDVRIYNNALGIKALYNSIENAYYGELQLFGNTVGNFDGTTAEDGYLSAGSAGLFAYPGTLITGSLIMSCLYATNPTLSGNGTTLLTNNCTNTGFISFQSPYNTYVNYAFGLNMYKQSIPVSYDTGNTLIQLLSQYDASKYIAEILPIQDTTPENVLFAGSGSAQLNTWYTTNVYTASVVNIAVPVILTFNPNTTSGYLIISGNTVGLTGIVNNGDSIQISMLTQTGYDQTTTGTITIGTVTTGFTVTTRGPNQTPTTGSFAFANFSNLAVNTFTGSTVTIAGIETGVLASISFDPITTSGRLEIYSGTTLINSGTTGLLVANGYKVKTIGQSSSGLAQTVTGQVTIGLGTGMFTLTTKGSDITPPTTPTITYPLSGEELFFITFEWTASTDTGSGIEGYTYEIAEDSSFVNIVNTGFITTVTGTIGSPNTDFDQTNDRFYWRIKAKDRDGNSSARSNTGYFEVVDFNNRDFTDKDNANLRTYYDSKEITLEGIKPGISLWARVDGNSTIYKNGDDKGTGTLVQNGDDLYITVRSSNSYNHTISSILSIANRALEFTVTTKDESTDGCILSTDDEDTIQTIFDSLVANYSGDQNRYDEFLYTMQSMLSDEIDFTNDCNLQYLNDLISSEIDMNLTGSINTGNHIAPNCKEYPINFDNVRMAYTSPIFRVVTFFANRDSLARYIDSKNPGDCHINTYGAASFFFSNTNPNKHIASNGKIYTIQNDSQGYTSNDLSIRKYFGTISELRNYIDGKNPPQEIRSHQVDTSFTPQSYIAPNGKEYTIYKTDRGYMSYKLMRVRYFSSLPEIQSYINSNNK